MTLNLRQEGNDLKGTIGYRKFPPVEIKKGKVGASGFSFENLRPSKVAEDEVDRWKGNTPQGDSFTLKQYYLTHCGTKEQEIERDCERVKE